MKLKKSMLTSAAAALVLAASPAMAAPVTYSPGDLIVGFTASGGQGSSQVVLVSLGAATQYRDSLANNFTITNIADDLEGTFGANWAERTDLFWGAIGVFNTTPEGGSANGDPDGTIYVSRARTAAGTAGSASSTAWNTTLAGENTALNQIGPMQSGFDAATASTNNSAVAVMNAGATTWDVYNPPGASTLNNVSFGAFTSTGLGIEQKFAVGAFGTIAGTQVEGALDLYRNLYDVTGAASFEGTIVIQSTGDVGFVSTVPEPTTAAMLGVGLLSVTVFRRRNRKA